MNQDDDYPAYRAVSALAALVAVVAVIGVVLGGGTVLAVHLLGVGSPSSSPSGHASLYIPADHGPAPGVGPAMRPDVRQPTASSSSPGGQGPDTSPLALPDDQGSNGPGGNGQGSGRGKHHQHQHHHHHRHHHAAAGGAISLHASPRAVGTYQRINLSGAWAGHDGVSLQVQRFESGWTDFPVDATVRGGRYRTWVEVGVSGVNRFRVRDPATGATSHPVSVEVHD